MNASDHPTADVLIIGAGAAGLMCAAIAGQRGRRICILDHADAPGKKILISGGGRCNFTNRFTGPEHFLSQNPHFCKSALARFTPEDFLAWLQRHRIPWHERKHGQLFCDRSARDIVTMLLAECARGGVRMQMQTGIRRIEKNGLFRVHTSRGIFCAERLVIATGGLSIPKIGASPFGLKVAEQFGLNIVPPRAALVPLRFSGEEKERLRALAGISLDVRVSCNNRHFREAMLFTHRGLSGPAILQISSYWQPSETIRIDLLPDTDIHPWLNRWRQQRPQARPATALAELLPKRLARMLCDELRIHAPLSAISERQWQRMDTLLHDWRLTPSGSEGYRTAEVTLGGIDTRELCSSSMEARRVPGLCFIGEVVDVTGHLGGFNFQWAWASAHACATTL